MIVIITGVSASWKTSLQKELENEWFKTPINFSTRESRWDYELDNYVFLSKEQFFIKLNNWDFIEHTNYWWSWYWISKILPEWNVVIVVDPIWRIQLIEYLNRVWIKYRTYFLEISKQTQRERLLNRWDSIEEINKRENDFKWFSPTNNCNILDWELDTKVLSKQIRWVF